MSDSPNENAPLLAQGGSDVDVYNRFSSREKYFMVAVVSWVGYLPLFISGSFMPSIPEIAHDLNTTESVISMAVAISILAASIGTLVVSRYCTFYGRRPIYLCGLPLVVVASIGIAYSRTVSSVMIWRFIQAMGASPGFSVGGGVIGDIYPVEQRGTAMGIYFAACLLGSALAPFVSGVISNYTSWRFMQITLAGTGMLGFILIGLFYPETMHPGTRGIDKWRRSNGHGDDKMTFVLLNPLKVVSLLKSPNLLLVSIASFAIILCEYVMITPLAPILSNSFGITDRAIIGLCYAPLGLGNIIGAPIAGRLSDYFLVKHKKLRNGVIYPEDRLRGTFLGAAVLCPFSVLGGGLFAQFVQNRAGLIGTMICLFFNGVGVDMVLGPIAAYTVDIMQRRSAESMAASMSFRAFLLTGAVAVIFPLINIIGVAATNAIFAGLSWTSVILLYSLIRYGDKMRAWAPMDDSG